MGRFMQAVENVFVAICGILILLILFALLVAVVLFDYAVYLRITQ